MDDDRLAYSVHSCSSVSNRYYPHNILVDAPQDPSSRWAGEYRQYQGSGTNASTPSSSTSTTPLGSQSTGQDSQPGAAWILLELDRPALLRGVHFGKFHRQHPCTLKDYTIYAGYTANTLKPIASGALKPDAKAERVDVAWREEEQDGGLARVVRFVKIVPISAQGPNYNVSIWHVALFGNSDDAVVANTLDRWKRANEMRSIRSILSHLRLTRNPLFHSLLASVPPATLEHPLLATLHAQFVAPNEPSWSGAEATVRALAREGAFDKYVLAGSKHARWNRLPALGQGRGGHQMTEYPPGEKIWVFGGFDGKDDHASLHFFDRQDGAWHERSREADEPWPSKRSCHKLVMCDGFGWMMGKYVDDPPQAAAAANPVAEQRVLQGLSDAPNFSLSAADTYHYSLNVPNAPSLPELADEPALRVSPTLPASPSPPNSPRPLGHRSPAPAQLETSRSEELNELWRFEFGAEGGKGRWELVCPDTKSKGGPGLIYDHQIVVDEERKALYVYGGTDHLGEYSGLYRYDIEAARWTLLFGHNHQGLQSRTGHCMLWNATKREIYIFGGLRSPHYLSDFWTLSVIDPDHPVLSCLTPDYSSFAGPLPAFTQRAILDPARNELVVLSGLMKESLPALPVEGERTGATQGGGVVKSELWTFDLDRKKWAKVDEHEGDETAIDEGAMDVDEDGEPSVRPTPRFAHQFIYSPASDSYFLMGGNPGSSSSSTPLLTQEVRLGDFWELKIERPKIEEVERLILLELRRQQFIEMTEKSSLDALAFLQHSLHAVVNHRDPVESEMFRSLLAHILRAPDPDDAQSPPPNTLAEPDDATYAARTQVFKSICRRFVLDKKLKEPEEELGELVDSRVRLVI